MNVVLKNNLEVIPILGDYYKDASYKDKEGLRCIYKITKDNIEIVGFMDDLSTIESESLKIELENVYIYKSHLKGESIEISNSSIVSSTVTSEKTTLYINRSYLDRTKLKGSYVRIIESTFDFVKMYKYDLILTNVNKLNARS